MSVELTSYLSQYAALTAEITANISKIGRLTSQMSENYNKTLDRDQIDEDQEKIGNIISQVEKSFEDAEELFEQTELEIRELTDQSERTKYNTQLQSFKVERTRLRKEFEYAKNRRNRKGAKHSNQLNQLKSEHNVRSELLSSSGHEDDVTFSGGSINKESNNAKQRLLENTETLERSGRKLEQGESMLRESEQVGAGVLSDLAFQREVLTRSRNRLRDTDGDLGTSSRILSAMVVRIQRSKVILSVIGVLVVCTILLFIYLSFEG